MKKIVALTLSISALVNVYAQNNTMATASMFHANNQLTGNYGNDVTVSGLTEKWKFKTSGKIFSSPAVLNGLVFVGSEDGNLYAINAKTGKQNWAFKTGGAVHSSPAVSNGTVYFGSFDGKYYAVDALTGKQKWAFKTGGEKWIGGKGYFGFQPVDQYTEDLWDFFISSPITDNNPKEETIYFGSSDGNLYAVKAKDGSLKWKFATKGVIHATPSLYNGTVFIGSWDTHLYAIDAKTGKEKWTFKTGDQMPMSGIQASATAWDGMVYFGARDAFFYALNAETGKLAWKYNAEGSWVLSTAAISNGVIYTGTSDTDLLLALDAKTGNEKGRYKTCGYVYSSPAIAGNTAFFGDFTGKFYALKTDLPLSNAKEFITSARLHKASTVLKNDTLNFAFAANGADLSAYAPNKKVMDDFYSLGSIVSSPVVNDGTVYFGSADGFLYALDISGKVPTSEALNNRIKAK